MHSPVITRIEFRYLDNEYYDFRNFDIVPYSGSLTENMSDSKSGHLHKTSLSFKKEGVNATNEAVFFKLRNRPAQFRVTDAGGKITLVGGRDYRARLTYTKVIDGSATGFNGYQCSVVCESPSGSKTT